jgi:hypothetical protein
MTYVTKEFHRVRQKWFLSLWYVRRKPCTYLASRLALFPNGPKWASSWASSLRSTTGYVQNNFWAYTTFSANHAPIFHNTNTVSKRTKTRFHRTDITEEFHRARPKQFPSPWYFRRKPCTSLASRFALSPNGPKLDSTWPTSPRSTIGCIQNNFWAYGTFGANRASILCQD